MKKKIVFTGGPGAGKTIITAEIARRHPDRFVLVPEAATQVYAMLQTRWDRLERAGRFDAQRRKYRLQLEQEARLAASHPDKTLLLDRATVDGAAYWPGGAEDFWRDLNTTHAAELARYDAVIELETCAVLGLYDGAASNACRFEDAAGAVATSSALRRSWSAHPRRFLVTAFPSMEDKIAAVERLLAGLIL
jgi:predicted ATPase